MLPIVSDELTAQKISEIRKKIESQASAFLDKKQLDSFCLPSNLLGREKEVEEILRCFDFKNKYLTPFISIYGRSGSGKSTVAKMICQSISDMAVTRFVNLRKARTVFGCVNLILYELGAEEIKSSLGLNKAVDILQEKLVQILAESKKRFFVIVLDEYDVLFSDKRGRPSDLVYKLLTLEEILRQKGYLLCFIAISNNAVIDYDLDDRVKSRMGSSSVFFSQYSKDEVFQILRQRAQKAFANKVDDTVLEYCAKLCSFDHGDARRAIELLRIAGELCDKTVMIQDVDNAFDYIQKDRILAVLSSSNALFRRTFASLARLAYLSDRQWHTTSDIYTQYRTKFSSEGQKPVSYRRFSDILKELEQTGLVISDTNSHGRYGMHSRFSLAVPLTYVSQIAPKMWEGWNKIKKARFEMKYNPKYNGTNTDAKYGKYSDQKSWRKILGTDEYLDG